MIYKNSHFEQVIWRAKSDVPGSQEQGNEQGKGRTGRGSSGVDHDMPHNVRKTGNSDKKEKETLKGTRQLTKEKMRQIMDTEASVF